MCHVALVLLLSLGAFTASEAVRVRAAGVRLGLNPAAVFKLDRSVLDKLFDHAVNLAEYAGYLPVPDVAATISGVDVQTFNFRISNFMKPVIKYTLLPPNKLSGTVELPETCVQGPYNATRRTFFKTQKDKGNIVFTAKKIQVNFQVTIGECESGLPNIGSIDCQSFLGPSSLKVQNATENFFLDIASLFAGLFRKGFDSQVCPIIKRLIGNEFNRFLAKIPNVLELNRHVAIKYRVKPSFGPNHFQIGLQGKCLTEHVSPFNPEKFVEVPSDNATVVLLISDAPFNDVAYQMFINNLFSFTINSECHSLVYSLVTLDCKPDETCLGQLAPGLGATYGADADVEVVFKADKAPLVEFQQDKAVFSGSLIAELSITPANGTETYHEATAAIELSGLLQIKIVEQTLYAKISIQKVTVHIDEEHNKKWEDKVTDLVKKVVEKTINDGLLLKGLRLKLPFCFGVTNPLIKFSNHTLQVQTGFEHKCPPSESSEEHGGHGGHSGGHGGRSGGHGGRSGGHGGRSGGHGGRSGGHGGRSGKGSRSG